jgi:hypothetical protein
MEIHHFLWENSLKIAIFNSYFDITRGYPHELEPPMSYSTISHPLHQTDQRSAPRVRYTGRLLTINVTSQQIRLESRGSSRFIYDFYG